MAVPTGDYLLRASVDLSPLVAPLVITKKVRIEKPAADVLDRIVARLGSKDPNVRRAAVEELYWFPEDGEVVGPRLVAALDDPDAGVRSSALHRLYRFPEQAAPHWKRFLSEARSEKNEPWDREAWIWLLARTAPRNDEVEKLLRSMAVSPEEFFKERCGHALQIYQSRHRPKSPAEDPR